MDMLRALSGRTHLVYTGVAFCCGGQALSSLSSAQKWDFYPLTEEQIQRYLATGEPFDKAGAYGIQGKGGLFVKGSGETILMWLAFLGPGGAGDGAAFRR